MGIIHVSSRGQVHTMGSAIDIKSHWDNVHGHSPWEQPATYTVQRSSSWHSEVMETGPTVCENSYRHTPFIWSATDVFIPSLWEQQSMIYRVPGNSYCQFSTHGISNGHYTAHGISLTRSVAARDWKVIAKEHSSQNECARAVCGLDDGAIRLLICHSQAVVLGTWKSGRRFRKREEGCVFVCRCVCVCVCMCVCVYVCVCV